MPEYLAPGVFVEEVSFRPKSIEGVSTSTTAFIGPTRKGPLISTPEIITSIGEFERLYGGLDNLSFTSNTDSNPNFTNYMAHAVRAYFDNNGKRLYIARCFVPRTDGGGEVTSTGIALTTIIDDGTNQAQFIARNPGSGYNGIIRVYEKKTRVTAVTMASAPEGSLLCVGGTNGEVAKPAVVQGGTPPFSLNHDDVLGLILNTGTFTITFQGTAAEAIGSDIAEPLNIPSDTNLVVQIDEGVQQTILLPSGSEITFASLLSTINENLYGGYACMRGNQLVIGTDRKGTSARVEVSEIGILGFDDTASEYNGSSGSVIGNGSGNVADLKAVTVEEINRLLREASPPIQVRASVPPSTGLLNLSTFATGSSATLQIQDTPACRALSLELTLKNGEDGATLTYYEKRGEGWIGADGTTTLSVTPDMSAELVTINLEAEDADNNVIPYEDLGFSSRHPRWLGQVLAQNPSRLIDALQNPYYFSITGSVNPFELHNGLFGLHSESSFALNGGNDGTEPTASTTVSGGMAYEDGLKLLEDIEDISILAAPGHSALNSVTFRAVQQALISHAERMKYRIAVLDTPADQTITGARDTRSQIDSSYAALYYPWVMVANPLARPGNEQIPREIALPPSGFVTGLYARTDINRGVWKAPANEVIRGALRFERTINQSQQEVLNPEGINCLRFFYGRGNRLWGARTASSDPEWKYVNVRRFFIYLKHSIDRSTQWAVFEPNGPRLWSNIIDTVTSFLYTEWLSGALLGTKSEDAFFVRCDRSTMTQNDLDNGRLICEVGVAVIKPAEFVIFRIGQKTADAK